MNREILERFLELVNLPLGEDEEPVSSPSILYALMIIDEEKRDSRPFITASPTGDIRLTFPDILYRIFDNGYSMAI